MLSGRKRKASPEKSPGNSTSKKLKVSTEVFRSPESPKVSNVAKAKVNKLLPEGYESIILTASTKLEEEFELSEAIFGCVRLPIITKEDALIWLRKFERKTATSYRTQKIWKNDPKTGLSKRKFLCNHQTGRVYSCKACVIFTIKDVNEIQTNPDYYLRDYPSQVIIQFCHNHQIDPDTYLKNLRPSAELRAIFGVYFANGHSPFSALICHKCDLHSSYGAEFYDVVSNGDICPSYNWCYQEYQKLFARKFVEPDKDQLNEKLNDAVNQYNAKCPSKSADLLIGSIFSLCICTPFMKSVFRSGFADDLITVRTFCPPKTVEKRQKLILFLCHTPIGSLPFGIVLTSGEDTITIYRAIKNLATMLGASTYSPKTIVADENTMVSKALKKSFPHAQVLFNEFQMLQSIWRVIRLVCQDDNDELQTVYNLFLLALNSGSEADFRANLRNIDIYAAKYPKLNNFLKYFKFRSRSYVLYARPSVEFDTDVLNYTDSGTIILQDVSIKYSNFFNDLQLFDFLTKTYADHYERKLVKICEGDLKGFFKTSFYVPLSKIADFTCEKVTDTEFLVRVNEVKFFVNAELDTCTCQVGVHGGSCVHQYIVEKNLGLVPECYTPLDEDMLNVFKTILSYKGDQHNKSSESFTENEISDHIYSVNSSECGTTTSDTENLGPLDEIFLAPSEVTDSFADEDNTMSPVESSEFEDPNEDNDELLNDSGQYNRESGELEHNILSPLNASIFEFDSPQKDAFVPVLPSISDEELLQQHSSDSRIEIAYDYGDDDTECHNTVEVLPMESPSMILTTDIPDYSIAEHTDVVNDIEDPVVYRYTAENGDLVEIYEEVMTESDKKTAEIAEFLTNLPDTNNLSYNTMRSSDPVVSSTPDSQHYKLQKPPIKSNEPEEAAEVLKRFQNQITPPEETEIGGVVVMKNDDYFTQYKVMENGILSIITDTEDEYANQINTFQTSSAQNFMGDSYEESNFVMMSPSDMFDNEETIDYEAADKVDPRINVLSSVVIKPSASKEAPIPKSPLNLKAIKQKTLRKVKETSRNRTPKTKMILVHETLEIEPENATVPAVEEQLIDDNEEDGYKINNDESANVEENWEKPEDLVELKDRSTFENEIDIIYEEEEVVLHEDVITEPIEASDEDSQEVLNEALEMSDEDAQEAEEVAYEEAQESAEVADEDAPEVLNEAAEVADEDEQEFRNAAAEVANEDAQEEVLYENVEVSNEETQEVIIEDVDVTQETNLTECDPAQLAEESFADIIEIDSDDLDELASQDYETSPIKSATKSSPMKVIPMQHVPLKFLPKNDVSITLRSAGAKPIPLRDFLLSKQFPIKRSPPESNPSKDDDNKPEEEEEIKEETIDENEFLGSQLTTAFSQLTNLANKDNFKGSIEKFLVKFKELGTDENLIGALESFGSYVPAPKKEEPDDVAIDDMEVTDSKLKDIPETEGEKYEKKDIRETEEGEYEKKVIPETVQEEYEKKDIPKTEEEEYEKIAKATDTDLEDWLDYSDTDEYSAFSNNDDYDSTEFEHYSDCRTSCSDFHSELEGLADFSNYSEPYSPNKSTSDGRQHYFTGTDKKAIKKPTDAKFISKKIEKESIEGHSDGRQHSFFGRGKKPIKTPTNSKFLSKKIEKESIEEDYDGGQHSFIGRDKKPIKTPTNAKFLSKKIEKESTEEQSDERQHSFIGRDKKPIKTPTNAKFVSKKIEKESIEEDSDGGQHLFIGRGKKPIKTPTNAKFLSKKIEKEPIEDDSDGGQHSFIGRNKKPIKTPTNAIFLSKKNERESTKEQSDERQLFFIGRDKKPIKTPINAKFLSKKIEKESIEEQSDGSQHSFIGKDKKPIKTPTNAKFLSKTIKKESIEEHSDGSQHSFIGKDKKPIKTPTNAKFLSKTIKKESIEEHSDGSQHSFIGRDKKPIKTPTILSKKIKKESIKEHSDGLIGNVKKLKKKASKNVKSLSSLQTDVKQEASKATIKTNPARNRFSRYLAKDSDVSSSSSSDEIDDEEVARKMKEPTASKRKPDSSVLTKIKSSPSSSLDDIDDEEVSRKVKKKPASKMKQPAASKLKPDSPPLTKTNGSTIKNRTTKVNPLAAGRQFKLNKNVTIMPVPSKLIVAARISDLSISGPSLSCRKPNGNGRKLTLNSGQSPMAKDAKELETILMGIADVDSGIDPKQEPKEEIEEGPALADRELSFLFNDSRFETFVDNSEAESKYLKINDSIKEERSPPIANKGESLIKNKKKKATTKYEPILYKSIFPDVRFVSASPQIKSKINGESKKAPKANKRMTKGADAIIQTESKQHSFESRTRANKIVHKKVVKKRGRPKGYLSGKPRGYLSKEIEDLKKAAGILKVKIEDDMEDSGLRRNRRISESDDSKKVVKAKPKATSTNKDKNLKLGDIKTRTEFTNALKGRATQQSKTREDSPPKNLKKNKRLKATETPSIKQELVDDSLDFENSIEVSVVERTLKTKRTFSGQKSKPLVTSTPLRPAGYEEAFRRFLQTSETSDKSVSDWEDYRGKSHSESELGVRRMAKSVSSFKTLLNRQNASKLSKSVSWAQDVDFIEYLKAPKSDSDDSEILVHDRKPSRSVDGKFKKMSEAAQRWNKLGQKPSRSSPASLKHVGAKKRVKSSMRGKAPKMELVVQLERNAEIDAMCQYVCVGLPRFGRSPRTKRKGYKELLEEARRMRGFDD